MVIEVANEHGDSSSNTGRSCLHFTNTRSYTWEKYESNYFPPSMGQTGIFILGMAAGLGEKNVNLYLLNSA